MKTQRASDHIHFPLHISLLPTLSSLSITGFVGAIVLDCIAACTYKKFSLVALFRSINNRIAAGAILFFASWAWGRWRFDRWLCFAD